MTTDAAGLTRNESGLDARYRTIAGIVWEAEPVEAYYRTLATILLAACPPGIDRAGIDARVEEGHVRAEYWYEKDGESGQPAVATADSFRIAEALSHVREEWPTKPPFSTATFIVSPDGTFRFEVGYAD